MQVAFYAPLKAPDHPVPSGDRTMARALVKALGHVGHAVWQPSRFRSFLAAPDGLAEADLTWAAGAEIDRISALWERDGAPDIWFTYHNHYRAPDLLGPRLARRFGLPYVVAEASHAPKRAAAWPGWNAAADEASRRADLHLCFTTRDRDGIARIASRHAAIADLPPFVDLDGFLDPRPRAPGRIPQLLTVAMMRPGDKLASYRFLGQALAEVADLPWLLSVVGDGPARSDVEHALSTIPADRVVWLGEMNRAGVLRAMTDVDLFVWPGFGEAFGLAYLEAEASGLPVLALDTAGVSSVVQNGRTGVLVANPSPVAYAEALGTMLSRPAERAAMGAAAADFVRAERSLAAAAAALDRHLRSLHVGVPARD